MVHPVPASLAHWSGVVAAGCCVGSAGVIYHSAYLQPGGPSPLDRTLCRSGSGLCTLYFAFSGTPDNHDQTICPGAESFLLPACPVDFRRLSSTAVTVGLDSGCPFNCLK